jgi:hypothetical protein
MGGRSGTSPSPTPRPPKGGSKGGGDGGGGGSGGPPGIDACPSVINTSVSGPGEGIEPGTWLQVELQGSRTDSIVALVDPVTGTTVGTLAGVPNLALLQTCLEAGVQYLAYVVNVTSGRVDVTVTRQ